MINELFPAIWYIVVPLIAAGTILFALGKWYAKVNTDLSSLGTRMDSVWNEVKEVRDEVRNEVKEARKDMKGVRDEVRNEVKEASRNMNEVRDEVRNEVKEASRNMNEVRDEVRNEVKEARKDMKEVRDEVRNEVKEVRTALYSILDRLPPSPAIAISSPVRLTEFGKKISDELSFGKWATDHAERLAKDASGKPEFEIFEMCVKYVADQIDEDSDFWTMIRRGAYEQGAEVEQVRKVCEVELRDALLALQDS